MPVVERQVALRCVVPKQVYITRHEWERGDNYLVWIGIENFSEESIFVTEGFPSLYDWVSRNDAIQQALSL